MSEAGRKRESIAAPITRSLGIFEVANIMNKEWNEGADAFYDFKGVASCPYPQGSEEHHWWTVGYYAAKAYDIGRE